MFKHGITMSEWEGSYLLMGDKIFRVVKNGEASDALGHGDVACYDGSDGETVKKPATATLGRLAGVVCDYNTPGNTAYSIDAGKYGTVQVAGTAKVKFIGESGDVAAAGVVLKAANGVINMVKDQNAGTAPSFPAYMIALEDGDSATAVKIDCTIHTL